MSLCLPSRDLSDDDRNVITILAHEARLKFFKDKWVKMRYGDPGILSPVMWSEGQRRHPSYLQGA